MAGKKRKNKSVPKGDRFMADVSTARIEETLEAEQRSGGNAKAVLILLACLWRRNGRGGGSIARSLNRPTSTVYAWLSKMHRHGLDARYDRPRPGRPRIIDPQRHAEISEMVDRQPEKCGITSGVWTGRLLLIMITGLLGIDGISRRTIYRTMHRMNKSWRKPGRPFDYRTPSDEVKEEFKSGLARDIMKAVADGFLVLWIDESHFTTKTLLGRTWIARGLSRMHRIKPFGKTRTCFAALGADGLLHHRYYERGNTDHMIEFVQSICEKYEKVMLVMDNASYHKSKRLMDHIKKYGGNIRIVYQPPYSPDLNPVEMVWKELKKYIANGIYRRTDDLTGAMDEMLRNGTVMLPSLPEYALDAIARAKAATA